MKYFRWILFPFALIFGYITAVRRLLYSAGILRRRRASSFTVVVGNVTVGGTGKTPFSIWLGNKLSEKQPAILSRGYGRKSKGFYTVDSALSYEITGDEPMEIFVAGEGKMPVYVCEDRLEGIRRIRELLPQNKLVILDDGFQHLKLFPDFSILLCNYHRPFFKDWPMPFGRLREFAFNARFCDAIVVTKCPENMNLATGLQWFEALARYGKPVFFATYLNSTPKNSNGEELVDGDPVVLVSALASNEDFHTWAEDQYGVSTVFSYPDHHPFTSEECRQWEEAVLANSAKGLLVTRKDLAKVLELQPRVPVFETHTGVELLFDSTEDLIALILTKIER